MANLKNVAKVALAVNAASAAAYSCYRHWSKPNLVQVKVGGEERRVETWGYLADRSKSIVGAQRGNFSGGKVTYLIAGIGSTAEESFGKILPYLDDTVMYVDFEPTRYSPEAVATAILEDICTCRFSEVRIIANSMAGRVVAEMQYMAQLTEGEPLDIRAYVIDPIFNEYMKPQMRAAATALSVLLHGVNLVGGWLRYAPLPGFRDWNWRTTALLADQMTTMAAWNAEPEPWWCEHLDGVVVSKDDWFSRHDRYIACELECYRVPYRIVDSTYCNTKEDAELYIEALRDLGALDWDVVAPDADADDPDAASAAE